MGTFFCRKPSPNFLSMNSERGIRNEIGLRRERDAERRKTLRALVCVRERMMIGSGRVNFDEEQCDQIWRFIILWASFQSPGQQLFCQNCQHILGNFRKGVKIFHFTRKILFGQLFRDIWQLLTGHTDEEWRANWGKDGGRKSSTGEEKWKRTWAENLLKVKVRWREWERKIKTWAKRERGRRGDEHRSHETVMEWERDSYLKRDWTLRNITKEMRTVLMRERGCEWESERERKSERKKIQEFERECVTWFERRNCLLWRSQHNKNTFKDKIIRIWFHYSLLVCFKNWPNPVPFCLFSFFSQDKYSTNLTLKD